jgi:hypothetical protein
MTGWAPDERTRYGRFAGSEEQSISKSKAEMGAGRGRARVCKADGDGFLLSPCLFCARGPGMVSTKGKQYLTKGSVR